MFYYFCKNVTLYKSKHRTAIIPFWLKCIGRAIGYERNDSLRSGYL